MNLNVVGELTESKLFPNKTKLLNFDEKYLGELVYVYLLVLIAIDKEDNEKFERLQDIVREYASRASTYRSFETFRMSGNDLYLAAHQIVQGPEGDEDRYIEYDNFEQARVIRLLKLIARGHSDKISMGEYIALEKQLRIKDSQIKSFRRATTQWERLDTSTKLRNLQVVQRILKRIGMRSEMLDVVSKAMKMYKEKGHSVSKEKHGSVGKTLAAFGAGAAAGMFLSNRNK